MSRAGVCFSFTFSLEGYRRGLPRTSFEFLGSGGNAPKIFGHNHVNAVAPGIRDLLFSFLFPPG
jgi:hypothetical protein